MSITGVHDAEDTYTPSEMRIYTHLGTSANHGATAMKLVLNVYMVGAQALGMLRATRAVRSFPNTPVGNSTLYNKPPTEELLLNPPFQAGTLGAAAANAAPRECAVTLSRCYDDAGNSTWGLTLAAKNARYV
jgi:hypothetical protein